MDDIAWYGEAALSSDTQVYCAGTLAQCVRRWVRLSEADQSLATIKCGSHTESRKILSADEVIGLAKSPDLYRI